MRARPLSHTRTHMHTTHTQSRVILQNKLHTYATRWYRERMKWNKERSKTNKSAHYNVLLVVVFSGSSSGGKTHRRREWEGEKTIEEKKTLSDQNNCFTSNHVILRLFTACYWPDFSQKYSNFSDSVICYSMRLHTMHKTLMIWWFFVLCVEIAPNTSHIHTWLKFGQNPPPFAWNKNNNQTTSKSPPTTEKPRSISSIRCDVSEISQSYAKLKLIDVSFVQFYSENEKNDKKEQKN